MVVMAKKIVKAQGHWMAPHQLLRGPAIHRLAPLLLQHRHQLQEAQRPPPAYSPATVLAMIRAAVVFVQMTVVAMARQECAVLRHVALFAASQVLMNAKEIRLLTANPSVDSAFLHRAFVVQMAGFVPTIVSHSRPSVHRLLRVPARVRRRAVNPILQVAPTGQHRLRHPRPAAVVRGLLLRLNHPVRLRAASWIAPFAHAVCRMAIAHLPNAPL